MKLDKETAQVFHLLAFLVGTRLISRLSAGYALVQGVSILVGGEKRFSASAYSVALSVPGAPWVWGVFLVVAGLLMAVGLAIGRDLIAAVGAFMVSVWSALFAITFAAASIQYEEANLTAMWVYGKDAVFFAIMAVILRTYDQGRTGKLWRRLRMKSIS
jgi:hypothetical protein